MLLFVPPDTLIFLETFTSSWLTRSSEPAKIPVDNGLKFYGFNPGLVKYGEFYNSDAEILTQEKAESNFQQVISKTPQEKLLLIRFRVFWVISVLSKARSVTNKGRSILQLLQINSNSLILPSPNLISVG